MVKMFFLFKRVNSWMESAFSSKAPKLDEKKNLENLAKLDF